MCFYGEELFVGPHCTINAIHTWHNVMVISGDIVTKLICGELLNKEIKDSVQEISRGSYTLQ